MKNIKEMTSGERVKILRDELNLTLEKFGERLGVTKTAISRIEKNERNCTEQMTKAICREYHVNYSWLVNGDGEMFSNDDADLKERIDQIMEGESEFHKTLIKSIINLDDESLAIIQKLIESLSSNDVD